MGVVMRQVAAGDSWDDALKSVVPERKQIKEGKPDKE